MKLNDIECAIENAEKNTGQLVEKKEEIESHEAHLQNAINKLEQDVQISKLLIEEKNDFSEQKSRIEQEIEKYKSEIVEIQDELNLMLSEAEENMRTLEDLEAVGEDVSETVNILQERKELIAEYEEQLKEIMDRLGMDFEGNQIEQKTYLSSNNTSPSMPSNSQEYQIANPDADYNNQNNSDNVEDVVNDENGKKKYEDLSDKVQYLDKMRDNAESVLSCSPTRKDDWDVVRGRLSDEYKSIADSLKEIEAAKRVEYNILRNEYFATNALPDSSEKVAKLQYLTERGRKISSEISDINSRAHYADTLSQDLARGLDSSKRTIYIGVGGKNFIEIHQNMIQKQGDAVPNFRGTCGDCSVANTMNALGDIKTEADVVQRARDLKACTDKSVPKFLPESIKNKIRGNNGGTSVRGRSKILDSFGYDCDNCQEQSLSDIANQLESGKGAIINVDHRVLNKQNDISLLNPMGTDHALTITGVEKNASGNYIGLWIHDTGVCSNMGNAFYCNANDYEIWKNTPNCTVQYVSKR